MTNRAKKIVPLEAAAAGSRTATVVLVDEGKVEIEVTGQRYRAALATHVPGVIEGQRVLAVDADLGADWLIVAAWPVAGSALAPPVKFDAATGTLQVRAARIDLTAVASIELVCGETSIRLNVDGQVSINGNEIISSALGAHRIEGASIDIN